MEQHLAYRPHILIFGQTLIRIDNCVCMLLTFLSVAVQANSGEAIMPTQSAGEGTHVLVQTKNILVLTGVKYFNYD